MEKGKGPFLKDKFGVRAYPTYLFVNSKEEVGHKIVGTLSIEKFIQEAKNALDPEKTIYGLSQVFRNSNHSEKSAIAYFDALDKAYEAERKSIASKIYFDKLEKESLLEKYN